MALQRSAQEGKGASLVSRTGAPPVLRSPAIALVTLIPLIWLLAATMTAGVQKIWHTDPRIGFLAQATNLATKVPELETAVAAAKLTGDVKAIEAATNALAANRTMRFNNVLDAIVAGVFLTLVTAFVLMSVRDCILLLARKKIAELRESPPVWLPDYALAEAKPLNFLGLITLGFALARELSGEAPLDRAQQAAAHCQSVPERTGPLASAKASPAKTPEQVYLEATEARFKGINRCC
jgi:carbon starvation protein